MSPETAALAWLHRRRITVFALAGGPAGLVVGLLVLGLLPNSEPAAELMAVGFGPLLVAGAAAMAPSAEPEMRAGGWLRGLAVSPRKLLLSSLVAQLVLGALVAGTLVLAGWLREDWSLGPWSELFDAPAARFLAFVVLLWCSTFAWSLALAWLGQPVTTAHLGGVLVGWGAAALAVAPGALLAGRLEEALVRWPALAPGLLIPPLLACAWALHRSDPLAGAWPARRVGALLGVALAVVLIGEAVALQPALEARALGAPLSSLEGVSVLRELPHPTQSELVAREIGLPGTTRRVRIDDGIARRVVLPEGTRLLGWFDESSPSLIVAWPGGLPRQVHPDGRTSRFVPGDTVEAWRAWKERTDEWKLGREPRR